METQRICPKCQKPLPADVPLGLCPECLIKAGFNTGTDPAEAGGPAAGFVPPPIGELARLFPQLEIIEFIGKGGMGAVYKARQPALDRFVALKILTPKPGGDPGFAERFNREARALARLAHPNIVAVHDFGRVDALHFLIMEFVDGANLRQVERAGRLRPEQALEIVPQICDALQFAHAEGIVHRDIKPENILLDKKGRVKITDFGIAKILGVTSSQAALTGAKDIVGTPHYMAPEQVEKPQLVDHRADIYSLGVVFYEMLTGELPLGKFQPPSKKVQVDVRLDEVVLHALEKEPERRYQHASEVKTAVETLSASDGNAAPRKTGAPASAVSTSSLGAASVGRRSVPWQIWVVVGLLGLEGLGNLFDIPRQPQAAIWLLAKVLFITGLLRRWRPVFVLNLVVAGIHVIYFAFHGPIAALLNLVLLVLVGSAYRFYFDESNAESSSPRESGTAPSEPERLTTPSQATAKSPRQRASLLGMGAGFLLPPVLFTWFLLFGHRLYGMDLDADVQFWLGIAGLPVSTALGLMLAWIGHMAFRSAEWLSAVDVAGHSPRWCPQAWVAAALLAVSLPFAGGAAVMVQLIALDGGGWHPGSSEFWIVMLLGAGALLTMLSATMLGLTATSQIRRARNQLRGQWPAAAAATFWPGLLLLAGGMVVLPGHAYSEPNLIVTGTVVDAETGKPIAGARVDDNRYGAGHAPQQAWTDASGGYELRTWYEEHTISASAPGYEPSLQTLMTKPFGKEAAKQMDFRLQTISSTTPAGSESLINPDFNPPTDARLWEQYSYIRQKMSLELGQRLQDAGYHMDSWRVEVSKDLSRARCKVGRITQRRAGGALASINDSAFAIRYLGEGRWLVLGERELAGVQFEVNTLAEMSRGPLPVPPSPVSKPFDDLGLPFPQLSIVTEWNGQTQAFPNPLALAEAMKKTGDYEAWHRQMAYPTNVLGYRFGCALETSPNPPYAAVGLAGGLMLKRPNGTLLATVSKFDRELQRAELSVYDDRGNNVNATVRVERIVTNRPPQITEVCWSPNTATQRIWRVNGQRVAYREESQPTEGKLGIHSDLPAAEEDPLEVLHIQLRQAEAELARLMKLHEVGRVPAADVEAAKDNVTILQARLSGDAEAAARARLAAAQRQLERTAALFQVGRVPAAEHEAAKAEVEVREAELRATIKARSNTAFGPINERIVAGKGDANPRFIDFDTGRLFAAAEFFGPKAEPSPEETQAWWKKTGIDAMGDTSAAVRGLVGFEMVAASVPDGEWEQATPARLDYYFTSAKPGTPATMSGKGALPATFAFKTREGGQGLLQITGFSDNPSGVKVRFKLVQTTLGSSTSSAPKTVARDGLTFSAKGDRVIVGLANGDKLTADIVRLGTNDTVVAKGNGIIERQERSLEMPPPISRPFNSTSGRGIQAPSETSSTNSPLK